MNKPVKIVVAIVVVAAFGLAAAIFWPASKDDLANEPAITQSAIPAGSVPFHLLVLSASVERPDIDYEIFIDDVLRVSDRVRSVDNDLAQAIEESRSHVFYLQPGKHQLSVRSQAGDASLDWAFEADGDGLWGLLGYERSEFGEPTEKHFELMLQYEPFLP